jgi:hypothetical protein
MAAEYPSEEQMKKMTQDQMRMRSTNSTIAQGPLSAMTAAQKAANPVQVRVPNMALPKSMAIRRPPVKGNQQSINDMDAMRSQGATVTPSSGVMRDRAMAIPTATDAANMQRGQARQMAEAKAKEPRSYESFGEFLKTMGLGK